jgi:KUP system potassium uptake protein
MRADNHGEGGILALLALLNPWKDEERRIGPALIITGLFGAALLYGDSIITPAISVLSAVEGLETTGISVDRVVVPLTIVILALLFSFQFMGTARIGRFFGPVMLIWFIALALLGIAQILQHPAVLQAINPYYAVTLCAREGITSLVILGAVFLAVTGGEALYADMGHFGLSPIRRAWFMCVFPCLVLNYFGQGALILSDPSLASSPFYHLAPEVLRFPLVLLATAATIIASQAVISGAFSLTRQAVHLGLCPRLTIIQTSGDENGQIFIPVINAALAAGTIGLVLGFKNSESLAAAYGIAVSGTMFITTILTYYVMRLRWRWKRRYAYSIISFFLCFDLVYLSANSMKFTEGGWLPVLVAGLIYLLMSTWSRGRELLHDQLKKNKISMEDFLSAMKKNPPIRIPGTGVFMAHPSSEVPPILPHHIKHNHVLHSQVLLITVVTEDIPRVNAQNRLTIDNLGQGFYRIYVHYGFMQLPHIPVALRLANELGLEIDMDHITYYLGHETIIPTVEIPGMCMWREELFALLSRNTLDVSAFYRLPPDHVVELGIQIKV